MLMEFKGFKSFESLAFSEIQLQSLVKHTTPNLPSARMPGGSGNLVDASRKQLGELLTRLGCLTIIVEHNYTDRDYKAEFSAFYSKRFSLPPAYCTRLLFFSTSLPAYGAITNPDDIAPLVEQESFLGFSIVRPTEFFRIGRTVIRFAPPSDSNSSAREYYVTCRTWHTVHLLGKEFKVLGMPFIQQDTQVGACAHAALWMVGRYMNARGHCGEISLPQINAFAKSRQARGRHYPAQDGLVSSQMLDALHEMGLFPVHYNYFDFGASKYEGRYTSLSDMIAHLIYYYVESAFPVIIEFEQHVIVAIGHTLNPRPPSHASMANRIPSFIIHDDMVQPYGELLLGKTGGSFSFEKIKGLIAILPSSAHQQGEFAETLADVMLKRLANEEEPLVKKCFKDDKHTLNIPSTYRLRTYMMKATAFLSEIQTEASAGLAPSSIVNLILRMEFPTYIWVSEVFASMEDEDRGVERCVGKILADSTAACWDKSVIAIVMERVVLLFDRQYLTDSPLIQPFPDDTVWKFRPRDVFK